MLLFDCTKDACAALTRTVKGEKVNWVRNDPLREQDPLWRWQLHAVTIARRPAFIAMQADTRFAMVFWGLNKGDGETLLKLFYERLSKHLIWLGEESGALDAPELDALFERLVAAHAHFNFRAGSDRSVQTHINDMVFACKEGFAEHGCLPDNTLQAASFEREQNQLLRSVRGGDYFCPDEAFLCACLRDFAGFDERRLTGVRERLQKVRQRQMAERVIQYADENNSSDKAALVALLKQVLFDGGSGRH